MLSKNKQLLVSSLVKYYQIKNSQNSFKNFLNMSIITTKITKKVSRLFIQIKNKISIIDQIILNNYNKPYLSAIDKIFRP